jgi:hypothetical protein
MREVPDLRQLGPPYELRSHPGTLLVCSGAQFHDGQWQPVVVSDRQTVFPYRRFIRATLGELGYEIFD